MKKLCNWFSPGNDSKQNCDSRYNQKDMDDAPRVISKESKRPENNEHNGDDIQ